MLTSYCFSYYSYVFPQLQSTAEKDTDVFTAKATLKNFQKLILQTSWNWVALHEVIQGSNNRIPAMSNAMLKFINKYHIDHFGFELSQASLKLKTSASNAMERLHHGVSLSLNTLQNSVRHLSDQGKDVYRKTSDSLMSMRMQNVINRLCSRARQVLEYSKHNIYGLSNSVEQFLSDVKLTVQCLKLKRSSPVLKSSSQLANLFQESPTGVSKWVTASWKRFVYQGGRGTILGTDVVADGTEIMDKLNTSIRFVYDQLKLSVYNGLDFLYNTVIDLV